MTIREIISAIFILAGVLCFCTALLGVFRFNYILDRMHASSIIDTLGTLLIFVGLIILGGFDWASGKILIILIFQWCTSPLSTQRIAKVEFLTNPEYDSHCDVE